MAGVWDLAPVAEPTDIWGAAPIVGSTVPSPKAAKDIGDAIIAGLQNSATGLALRGKLPEQQLSADAPWYMRAAAGVGEVVADTPLSIAGAVAGAVAGSGAAPGPGTIIGAGAGGFAAPMALREALVDAYTNDYATSWQSVWEIAKSAMWGGTKGAAIGAATLGAGRLAAPLVAPAGKIVGGTATFGAELATMTTTAAALEGHMPTWQQFMDGAILLGGLKGAVSVAGGLRRTYAATGKTPEEVLADAKADPSILHDLKTDPTEVPSAYRELAMEERIKAAMAEDIRPEQIVKEFSQPEPVKLGEGLTKDPTKYEYVTDQDTLKGLLRATETVFKDRIAEQTQGVVTNKETAALAMRSVAAGDVAEHVIGTAENAIEIYARAHVLKGVTQNAYEKVRALANIPEADLSPRMKLEALAAIEQLSMVLAEYRGARAEAGRALQVFQKIKRDASVLGDAETLIKLAERKGPIQDVAKMVAALKDPAQMQRFAEGYTKATKIEKVLEAWKAGILSGPQTHLANLLGNGTKWLVEMPESVLAATIHATGRALKGDPLTMQQYKARAMAPIYGLQMGATDALKVAGEVWKHQGEHIEKADVYRTAIEGKKGEVIRIPFRLLQVEDALFRTVAERAQAHIMAVDRVTKMKMDTRTAEAREMIVKMTEKPELGLSEEAGLAAIKAVQEAGAEAVFSQRLGPRLETVQRAMAGHPVQFIMPFFRTPANLVSWAIQHTPGLNLLSGRWRDDFAAGGERQARAIARVTIGAGLALGAFSMAKEGLLTGGGLFDPEQRRTKTAAGWQPYSVQVGDKYYSYQRIEPVAKVLGLTADMVEMMESKKFDEADMLKAASMLTLMLGNATVSTTYLSGLANAMNAVLDSTRYGEPFLEQYASSLVPKIVGQTVAMTDPYKREVEGVMDAVQSQLPFLREKLLPKRDAWGEPSRNDKWFEVLPVATSEESHDKVKQEAVRLQIAIADAPKFATEKGPFNPKDKRVEMTIEQRDVFREVAGKNAMTILAPIVNAPDWERIPDFAKAEIYRKVIEGTRKQGAFAALPPDAPAREEVRKKILTEIIRQTSEAQGK